MSVSSTFHAVFMELEALGALNHENETDLYCLHFVFYLELTRLCVLSRKHGIIILCQQRATFPLYSYSLLIHKGVHCSKKMLTLHIKGLISMNHMMKKLMLLMSRFQK